MSLLSVVVPSYNEELMISKTALTVSDILSAASINYELIFVDDGSKDSTWSMIQKVAENNNSIKGLHFSKNFGKESAIIAGLSESKGDCCVVIDCDLQHPPQKIVDMYHLWENGYEIIEGLKSSRGSESVFHSLAAKMFYSIISKASGLDMENTSDFKLLDKKAVNVLINMHERNAFFRALSSWIGFETTTIEFEVQDRELGESKWSTLALIKYALNNMSSFSSAPMQIVTLLGSILFLLSIVLGVTLTINVIMGRSLPTFDIVIVLMLFTNSIMMIGLGIVGYYIARIYEEIKGRPKYIISKTCGI